MGEREGEVEGRKKTAASSSLCFYAHLLFSDSRCPDSLRSLLYSELAFSFILIDFTLLASLRVGTGANISLSVSDTRRPYTRLVLIFVF